ncbi:MAG TPA: hypothetical protein VEL07_14355, partial [Planctomycetota bacterium]|nr:hypothetical protein [Planctomycetota bacterium]
MIRATLVALLALVAVGAWAADDQPWAESETLTDTVYFKDGDPEFGRVAEENGKLFLTSERGARIELNRDLIDHVEYRRMAPEIVAHNAPLHIAAKDSGKLIRTLDFGFKKKADEATMAALRAGLAAMPADTELAKYAFAHLTDPAEIERVARTVLKTSKFFEVAYEALGKVLLDANSDELDEFVELWHKNMPGSPTANRLKADISEKRGDLRSAKQSYETIMLHHAAKKDIHPSAVLGFARCALKLGEHKAARDAAAGLLADATHGDDAAAIAGAAWLAGGDAKQATPLLARAVAGKPSPEMAAIARYDLGLAQWKSGDVAGARQTWAQGTTAESTLAMAILERKPFRDVAALNHARLKAIAQEHNACLDLEAGQHAKAVAALDPSSSKRHRFLKEVGDVIASNGDPASARALVATPGVESLRWQAYAHMLASRWRDAEATLAKLPADDGWAAVYRVYCAAAQRDEAGAKAAYQRIAGATAPPADYLARLAAEYEIADAARDLEEFDWKDGEVLGTGWQSVANGTNIRIHAAAGRLMLEGAQTASPDPVSRAWRLVQSERLRGAVVEFDLSGVAAATAGIELTDVERTTGVAVAVLADGFLGWRALGGGRWGAWEKLPLQVAGARPKLMIKYQNGIVSAASPERPDVTHPLGARLF